MLETGNSYHALCREIQEDPSGRAGSNSSAPNEITRIKWNIIGYDKKLKRIKKVMRKGDDEINKLLKLKYNRKLKRGRKRKEMLSLKRVDPKVPTLSLLFP